MTVRTRLPPLGRWVLVALLVFFAIFASLTAYAEPTTDGALKPELHLDLLKKRWHKGEYLWYRLELRNSSKGPLPVYDPFWARQDVLSDNWEHKDGLYLRIFDEAGKEVSLAREFDVEGVFYLWASDRFAVVGPYETGLRGAIGRLMDSRLFPSLLASWVHERFDARYLRKWDRRGNEPLALLPPGQSLTATGSVVKPVEPSSRDPHHPEVEGDPRLIPYEPHGWPADRVAELKGQWKDQIEYLRLWGVPPFRRDSKEPGPPSGYRVLERIGWSLKPGKYTIRAVSNEWSDRAVESNVAAFEVVP